MLGRYGPWLIVGLVVLTIFGLSHQPHSAEFTQRFLGQYNFIARKAAHCVVYAALFMALSFAATRTFKNASAGWIGWWCVVACGIYAASDEFHQIFVPGRTPLVSDVLLDTGAVFVAYIVWAIVRRLFDKPHH